MKRFLKYSACLSLTLAILAYAADFAFTSVYRNAVPRNKLQYIVALPQQVKFDNVFLGSSRTANHVMTKRFSQITGQSAINLGMEGAVLEDNLLQLELLLSKRARIGTVYLQVDYLFEKQGVSNIANSAALPFIRNEVVRKHLENQLPDFASAYYLPFYRYMMADHAIGFREFFFSSVGKRTGIDLDDGFSPKRGTQRLLPLKLPERISRSNATLQEFKHLCKSNGIELVLFCAPFCSKTQNLDYIDKLREKLPGLRDYSRLLDDTYFFNCAHLNEAGAEAFTETLAAESRDR